VADSTVHFASAQSRTAIHRWRLLAILTAILVAGCSKPVEKVDDVRPVRAIRLTADTVDVVAEFSGEVRPRIESRLAFQAGGKIVARKVEIGTTVKRGQILMQLDPQDLKLAQAQANAALQAATSNRDLASAELKRYRELREKNFVSQAVLDSKLGAFKSAQAAYEQALAGFRSQSNLAGYSALHADVDGVVTGIEAEVGQVVAAGAPVVSIARTDEKEIVIGIPEDKVGTLRQVSEIRVRTWARPEEVIVGEIREVSPVADPATRTYAARIGIPRAPEHVRLGMTAYVAFVEQTPDALIKLPLTALFKHGQGSAVWVVDKGQVNAAPVEVAGTSGNEILVSRGVSVGQTVVTAGVNVLKPGQQVKILEAELPANVSSADGQLAAEGGAAK
jgi:multidrug efflux system membrane fusion protein